LKDRLTKDDVAVVVIHDHGSRYVGKIYNDDWMRERGFLDTEMKLKDLVAHKNGRESFIALQATDTLDRALHLMKEHDISQLPVLENDQPVGALTESAVLSHLLENPNHHQITPVRELMGQSFPVVEEDLPFSQLRHYLSKEVQAVFVKSRSGKLNIITQYDVLKAV
jgi:cystathionine beta-synthase